MPMEVYALCQHSLENVAHLQSKIDRLGCDLKLAPSGELADHTGFLPARWNGRDAGFEFWPMTFAELRQTDDDVDLGGPWNHVCAMYFSTLPRAEHNGLVFDPQEETLSDPDAAARITREAIAEGLQIEASQPR